MHRAWPKRLRRSTERLRWQACKRSVSGSRMKRARELLVGRTRSRRNELIRRPSAEEIHTDRSDLPVDSRSRCETTTGRDNELFLIEKFILSRPPKRCAHIRDRDVGISGHHVVTKPPWGSD